MLEVLTKAQLVSTLVRWTSDQLAALRLGTARQQLEKYRSADLQARPGTLEWKFRCSASTDAHRNPLIGTTKNPTAKFEAMQQS